MKKIQILGTGCAKCEKLAKLTAQAADSSGIQYELEKVTDIQQILSFGVMLTPALVVDGEVKLSGSVPAVEEISKLLI